MCTLGFTRSDAGRRSTPWYAECSKRFFEEGLFHADAAPRQCIRSATTRRLSLLDFGMTGDLDEPCENR